MIRSPNVDLFNVNIAEGELIHLIHSNVLNIVNTTVRDIEVVHRDWSTDHETEPYGPEHLVHSVELDVENFTAKNIPNMFHIEPSKISLHFTRVHFRIGVPHKEGKFMSRCQINVVINWNIQCGELFNLSNAYS